MCKYMLEFLWLDLISSEFLSAKSLTKAEFAIRLQPETAMYERLQICYFSEASGASVGNIWSYCS